MDKQIDFRMITPCGECCAGCLKKQDGFCQGCLESGGKCKEWEQSGGCPIFLCCVGHSVSFCGLCPDFPCQGLRQKAPWNPSIVEDLAALAALYSR